MAKSRPQWQTPGVKFGDAIHLRFRRGVDQLVNAIGPTLGPYPRVVVNQPMMQNKMPEFLDNGAIIARRIVMLPDRIEDVGAMYLREMLWNVYETAGDGTATAAVLFHSIYDQGLRYIAAGGNAMILRRCFEDADHLLLAELEATTVRLDSKEKLAGFANSICHDSDLSAVLAEAFDLLGLEGRLDIRSGRNRKLVLELFDGLYWDGGLFSHNMVGYGSGKISLTDPFILITDLEIKEPRQLVPLLELACQAGIRDLVLMATRISEPALALLLLPANRACIQVMAIKLPADNIALRESLEDLTLLVGGRPLLAATSDTLEAVRLDNLGRARRAWADKEHFGIESGRGDPRQLRQRIAEIRGTRARAQDHQDRKGLEQRLSKLIYGSAVLWVGATTPVELEARQELAKRTVEAMRGALREGVLPGGGAALLNLKQVLQEKACQVEDTDEKTAYRILQKALEAPIRALLCNAGHRPETILAEIGRRPAGTGFDVMRGEVRDMNEAGIMDSAAVIKSALCAAIRSAALALTIEVLIQRPNPPMGMKKQ